MIANSPIESHSQHPPRPPHLGAEGVLFVLLLLTCIVLEACGGASSSKTRSSHELNSSNNLTPHNATMAPVVRKALSLAQNAQLHSQRIREQEREEGHLAPLHQRHSVALEHRWSPQQKHPAAVESPASVSAPGAHGVRSKE